MVLISVKALTLLLWYSKVVLSSKIVCVQAILLLWVEILHYTVDGHFPFGWWRRRSSPFSHFVSNCAWQAKVPGKGFNLSAPTTCHMLGQTSLLVGQLFCKGGRKWGTPLTMSDVPPLVYLWSCENLQHCWKHFLASKITKMSELVGNLFLFFVVPSLVGLFSFQFLWCTTPHHTAAGDHPSTKKRN